MLKALLEIGCEEIPARFMPGFLQDLKKQAQEKLEREKLSFSSIQTLGTYRRLTLVIEGLAKKQPDESLEIKGPPAEFAFDGAGKPTKAAAGFARSQGATLDDLEVRTLGSKNYVFAKVTRKGQSAAKVLAKLFPEIISSLYQPLSMRWGSQDFKFIRPIHSILALCGDKIVKFELAGIKTSNNLKIKIQTYKQQLKKKGIIVDQDERKALIKKQVEAAAKKVGAKALVQEDLLEEVNFLVENPIAYVGKIDKSFLSLPQKVLITSMKKNQKYFPLVDSKEKLVEKFVLVSDGCKNKGIVEGNQKVLTARLSDAKFFFEEDKKQPLQMYTADLDKIEFFKGLGSLAQKVERMQKLSLWIAKRLNQDGPKTPIIERICQLCKADLSTRMVYEFPVLQGIMGREYALLSKEDPRVAQGIAEHYLPRFADDKLPESKEGMIVALADRIDSIVGCFSIGKIPSGSQDPYALRRAVHGIIRIIIENKLDLLLDEVIEHSYKLYESRNPLGNVQNQILAFMASRVKPILLEKGIRYDVVDAVLSGFNDILDVFAKAKQINGLISEKWFVGVVKSADRVSRIAKGAKEEAIDEAAFVETAEKKLYELYMKVNWEVGEAINKEEWQKAIKPLAELTDPIELFFEKVMVMHKDEKLKKNRLALLKAIEKMYLGIADFRRIVLQ